MRMKRIYLCCILLILLVVLTLMQGGLLPPPRLEEGFQTRTTAPAIPSTIKCTAQRQGTAGPLFWFCDDKNQADALLAANYPLATEPVCVRRGNAPSMIYSCLEEGRADKRYLLNRQHTQVCDFMNKSLKDLGGGISTGEKLRTIAQNTLNTILATEPNIQILKTRNPNLTGFLDEKGRVIETQKAKLRGYESDLGTAINNNNNFRSSLTTAINKMKC